MDLLYISGLLATAAFAASGVLAALGKRIDLFGAVVVAVVTAVGGGTLRDLILDAPVFWLRDEAWLLVAVVIGCLAFSLRSQLDRYGNALAYPVEKFSIVKTLQAIEDSHVVILVVDAQEGLVEQDMHLMGTVVDAGRALVVAVNKWDHLDPDVREKIRETLKRRLSFIPWAKIHYISALHGTGVGDLYGSIKEAYEAATTKFSTNVLTRILEDAVADHQPPLVRGRRIKLRYAHQGGMNPPRIIIHGNQTKDVPEAYRRYLENIYRRVLNITGSPVKIEFKSGENPFAGRKNKLTDRQIQRKRRLMKFVKQKK